MDFRKTVFRETGVIALGEVIGVALMFGVFALLGRFDRSVLLGGISNQWDRLRRGSVTDYLQFPHRKAKKRALVWNLADFMLIGGVVLTVAGLVKELIKK